VRRNMRRLGGYLIITVVTTLPELWVGSLDLLGYSAPAYPPWETN
jgi:hypothetical protein